MPTNNDLSTLDEVLAWGPIVANRSEFGLYVTVTFNRLILWAGNQQFARVAEMEFIRTPDMTFDTVVKSARKFLATFEAANA